MTARCAWVACQSPAEGWWCADHAARFGEGHDVDCEPAEVDQ